VEVAPLAVVERGGVALQAVGLDVAAEAVGHGLSFGSIGGYPPGISLEVL
jgi:hypothetical protein